MEKSCENCLNAKCNGQICGLNLSDDDSCDLKYWEPDYLTLEQENTELKVKLEAYELLYKTEQKNHDDTIDRNCKVIRDSETALNNACVMISESNQALKRACEWIGLNVDCRDRPLYCDNSIITHSLTDYVTALIKHFKEAK